MITIKITDRSICMNGHADRKDQTGIDRVCAAVSALTCNLINSLNKVISYLSEKTEAREETKGAEYGGIT